MPSPTQPNPDPTSGAPAPGATDTPPFRYTARLAGDIEGRWQARWEERGTFRTPNPGEAGFDGARAKFYCLDMFPYPSGAGLHVGHPEGYTATDIISRFKRMKGFNVLHPMGWDAFGLPAEQYAIQTGVHPAITTRRAIDTFRRQLKRFGFSYDWSREFATIDEDYYRWTQWIFLQIYHAWYDAEADKARPIAELVAALERGDYAVGENARLVPMRPPATPALERERGAARPWSSLDAKERRRVIDGQRLAYIGEQVVNWCPKLGTALANEEVIDGRSERGGFPVFRKPLRQWMFRITAFADRLLRDLEGLDWPVSTRTMQQEWIGRSEGAEIDFPLAAPAAGMEHLRVYTTRPDTIFGATYMVVAPEHPLCDAVASGRLGVDEPTRRAMSDYCAAARNRSDVERQESKTKTGAFTGVMAVNPATGEKIPVWAADYVLMGYGHGAIMAVPAHDERDFEFAAAFKLPIRDVIYPRTESAMAYFAAHATIDERSEVRWQGILSDFLGYTTTENTTPAGYGAALEVVRTRRSRSGDGTAVPIDYAGPRTTVAGSVGFKRGSVATTWLDSVADIGFATFEALRGTFERRGYYAHRGEAFSGHGTAVNSANASVSLNGLVRDQATAAIIAWLEREGIGRRKVNFKLRDWLFSRQRYWGEPFPIVYDEHGDHHAVSEAALPVVLPELKEYQPEESEDPRPLLAKAREWVSTTAGAAGVPGLAPGAPVTRETNTMPGWAGSCWYFLRYCDSKNGSVFCGSEAEKYWMGGPGEHPGVDLYVGGSEHAVLHLLYARFWHKALFDLGHVSHKEPFKKLFHQGLITSYAFQRADKSLVPTDQVEERGEGGFVETATGQKVTQIVAKMSKSLKNVVNPDDVIAEFGADTFRLYEMYMGPLEASKPWNPRDIAGCFRFLQRAWRLCVDEQTGAVRTVEKADVAIERLLHRAVAKVEGDIERLAFNTAIAAMMEFVNAATSAGGLTRPQIERFTLMLCPFAPHLSEELWAKLGKSSLASTEAWPGYDPALLRDESIEMPVQIQGKVRARITVPAGADAKAIEAAALADSEVQKHTAGKPVKKVIVVPGKLVNIVTG